MPSRSVTEIQEEYTKAFMAIPGVVGTAVGSAGNGLHYILVLVEELTPEIGTMLPKEIEGYPVRIELTGKLKPQ